LALSRAIGAPKKPKGVAGKKERSQNMAQLVHLVAFPLPVAFRHSSFSGLPDLGFSRLPASMLLNPGVEFTAG
jgi:hypothetical protein